jgi:hypothetical protein
MRRLSLIALTLPALVAFAPVGRPPAAPALRASQPASTFLASAATPPRISTNPPVTCDTSWRSAVSGSWYDSGNWTNGAPEYIDLGNNQPGGTACITVPGTYTVTAEGQCPSQYCPGQGDVAAGAGQLVLGGSSGTQTVMVASDFSDSDCDTANGSLAITGNANVGPNGVIHLIGGDGSCTNNSAPVALNRTDYLSVGTLTLDGTLQTDQGSSVANAMFLWGNVVNEGTINVNFSVFYDDGASSPMTLDNEGALNLANDTYFGDSGQNFMSDTLIINDTGGSINNTGDANAGSVRVSEGNSFEQGGGTTLPDGTDPASPSVILTNAPLSYTGTGASSIAFLGNSTISGNLAAGQNLTIESADFCGFVQSTSATANSSFTNAGVITLTQISPCGGHSGIVYLGIAGTLTNTGTMRFEQGNADPTSSIRLAGNITNAGGIMDVDFNTLYDEGASNPVILDNAGAINLADGAFFGDAGNRMTDTTLVNDTGGSISNSGDTSAGVIVISHGNTFIESAGTTTPSTPNPDQPPIQMVGGVIKYTASGASTIEFVGGAGGNSILGNVAKDQNIVIQPNDNCGFGQNVSVGTSAKFKNAGTITFRASDCGGSPSDSLYAGSGTFTNSGYLSSVVPSGGVATVYGSLKSGGTISIAPAAALTINGTLDNYDSATGTLTGGKYLLSGTLFIVDTRLTAGIANLDAKVTLSGGSVLDAGHNDALRNLRTIGATGLVELEDGSDVGTSTSLTSSGTISTSPGSQISVAGNFAQTATGVWKLAVADANDYGQIVADGTSQLDGKLALSAKGLASAAGTTITPLSASLRTGTFATTSGTGLGSGRTLAVTYTNNGVNLAVQQRH